MIRPFRLGDIFLIQRLGRQATDLNAFQALMHPSAPLASALTSVIPWSDTKVATYVLNQQGNPLARAGFIQVQKRQHRPEYGINLLAPALDTPSGHPAIWEKLLSHSIQEAARHQIERIYVDVPDQPLPVSSFAHVGFTTYTHQTIWRLRPRNATVGVHTRNATIRPVRAEDEWALSKLYSRVTPVPVQRAECGQGAELAKPPLLDGLGQSTLQKYALIEDGEVVGCLQIWRGRRGACLRTWAEMPSSDGEHLRQLIRFGLSKVWAVTPRFPIYVGVNDYHGGLGTILDEFGFAPFTDRAKMVKQVMAWVKEGVPAKLPQLEQVGDVVTPFVVDPWTVNREATAQDAKPVGHG